MKCVLNCITQTKLRNAILLKCVLNCVTQTKLHNATLLKSVLNCITQTELCNATLLKCVSNCIMQTELCNATLLKRMQWIVQCNSLLKHRYWTVSRNCAMHHRKWDTAQTCQTKLQQNVLLIYCSQLFCTKIHVSALYGAHFISAKSQNWPSLISRSVTPTLSNCTVGFLQTCKTPTPKDHQWDHWHVLQPTVQFLVLSPAMVNMSNDSVAAFGEYHKQIKTNSLMLTQETVIPMLMLKRCMRQTIQVLMPGNGQGIWQQYTDTIHRYYSVVWRHEREPSIFCVK